MFPINRLKLSAAVFVTVLIILSITQIMADTVSEHAVSSGSLVEDRSSKKDYSILIDIEEKTLYLLDGNACVKEYTIASGRSGLPSPLGCWTITEKGDWGEGFGGRWMGLDVPWGTYGIHGTLADESIGSAASHGCIRMFSDDAAELYRFVSVGTDVMIVNGPYGPFGRGFDEVNPGDRGADVYAIQQRLNQLGFTCGEPDGIYEDGLKKALHKFQRTNGLKAQNTITKAAWLKMGFREFE